MVLILECLNEDLVIMTNPFREDIVYKYQFDNSMTEAYFLYQFKEVSNAINPNLYYVFRKQFKDNNLNGGITITDTNLISLKEIDQYKPYAIEIRGAYYKIK